MATRTPPKRDQTHTLLEEARAREQELIESEKRLRDLIDATAAVIYVKALDGRRVEVVEVLRSTVRAKLEVANPRYLESGSRQTPSS